MGGRALCRTVLMAMALMLVAGAAMPEAAQARPRPRARGWSPLARTDLVIEAGVAQPLGDLGDDYLNTINGFGAETGYEVGVRYRAVWRSGWALSPSFHFADYGDFAGLDTDDTPFVVKASVLRYGLDAQYFWNPTGSGPQPFVSCGLALCRNRYRDETLGTSADFYDRVDERAGAGGRCRSQGRNLRALPHLQPEPLRIGAAALLRRPDRLQLGLALVAGRTGAAGQLIAHLSRSPPKLTGAAAGGAGRG